MKTILTFIMLALCISAQARIGETVDECVKRYGKPTSHDEATGLFTCFKDGMMISLRFLKGKCSQICFARMSPTMPRTLEPMRQEEIDALLSFSGSDWEPWTTFTVDSKRWTTADKTRMAQYNSNDCMLVLMTLEQAEADAAVEAAAAQKKLKGF